MRVRARILQSVRSSQTGVLKMAAYVQDQILSLSYLAMLENVLGKGPGWFGEKALSGVRREPREAVLMSAKDGKVFCLPMFALFCRPGRGSRKWQPYVDPVLQTAIACLAVDAVAV